MVCFFPVKGFRSAVPNENGRRPVFFDAKSARSDEVIFLACGQCIGCRLERSRQWAVRCCHEASLYDDNCFVTLTYNDESLPFGGTLVRRDLQLFVKRLRKYVNVTSGGKFRFFGCGEYGDLNLRPHYHILLFGYNFEDRYLWRNSPSGFRLYRSEILERLWSLGNCEIGDVSFESAAYTARYCVKKINGDRAVEHYGGRLPEFGCWSNRPGVGLPWLTKYQSDVYNFDYVVVNGVKARPPRYYDKKFEEWFPVEMLSVKDGRDCQSVGEVLAREFESSSVRLAVKAEVTASRISQLKRNL